jgi:hypothetical protein
MFILLFIQYIYIASIILTEHFYSTYLQTFISTCQNVNQHRKNVIYCAKYLNTFSNCWYQFCNIELFETIFFLRGKLFSTLREVIFLMSFKQIMSIISTSKFCNLSSVNNFFDKRCKLCNWTLNLTSLLSMALRNTNEHYTNQNYLLRSFISKSLNSHNMIRSSELKAIKVFYWQNNFLFQRYLPSRLQLIKLR